MGKLANLVVVEGKTYFSKGAKWWSRGLKDALFNTSSTETKKGSAQRRKRIRKRRRKENCIGTTFRAKGFGKPSRRTLYRVQAVDSFLPDEILTGHDLLVQGGKIAALAPDLKPKAPPGCKIVEGRFNPLTPGLIDCHTHAMILGRVNESTMPSTAMVRIASGSIRKASICQLAGGLTA